MVILAVVTLTSFLSVTVVLSSDLVSNSTDSVLSCTVSVFSLTVVGFSVVVFLVGNILGILLTVLWTLSSVCGWTKFALSMLLSSMLLPMIWGRMVLSGIWQHDPK